MRLLYYFVGEKALMSLILSFKFTLLGYGTVRGAAGASILSAEPMHARKFLE